MIRFLSALVAVTAFLPLAHAEFMDVPTSHPHAEAIDFLQKEGIVDGYSMSFFLPDVYILRAEFVKIITEALLKDEEIETCIARGEGTFFKDVDLTNWYAQYVCAASEHGLVTGYPDGTFRIGDRINTAEAAAILARAYAGPQKTSDPWYSSSLETLGSRNALPHSLMHVGQALRRSEMAEMIYRLSEKITSEDSFTAEQLQAKSVGTHPVSYHYDYGTHTADLPVGAQVGGMRFMGTDTSKVIFTGDIVVTGRYTDTSNYSGLVYGGICVDEFDQMALGQIPGAPSFCLKKSAVLSSIPAGSQGKLTVRISRIERNHCECEAFDVATVAEVISVEPDPTNAEACLETGGDWQENAVRAKIYNDSEEITIRGVCYPIMNAYAHKMTAFDSCGPFHKYTNRPWFHDLSILLALEGVYPIDITEVCAALDNSMAIVLFALPESDQSQVWRYDVRAEKVEQARVINEGPAFHMSEFGKREGHIVPLYHYEDFPDLCRARTDASYDYISNVVTNIGGGCIEMYNS